MKLKMTLDELINTMEPQVRKDKALISKCIDGLTEYAAELRQKAGDPGKAQTPDLRRLVSELEGCWGLDISGGVRLIWALLAPCQCNLFRNCVTLNLIIFTKIIK